MVLRITVKTLIERLQAFNYKWRRWYLRQTDCKRVKVIPKKHREYFPYGL